ncbi:TPA: reverse transcriptase domain-containing protein [Serratia liquefaciens]
MKTPTTMTPAPCAPAITTIPTLHLCPQQAGATLDAACVWLCEQRKDAPPDADVWDLRFTWAQRRDRLLQTLLAGGYRLKPMQVIKKKQGDALALWGAQDALVLKWVALLIVPQLDLHEKCEHVKGHGGGPASIQRMADALRTHGYRFVCRTDIRGYYDNIRKDALLAQVQKQVLQPVLQNLIAQYVHYTVEDGGEFHTPERGISRGCALSPLMGALHLRAMDEHFAAQSNIYYARYMDDIVILTPTRWALRRQVKALNGFFNAGGFEQHPDKTFMGRTERGYDWMGAQMNDAGVEGIARRARSNHVERCRRLYGRVRGLPAALRRARMAAYRKRWMVWAACLCAAMTHGTASSALNTTTQAATAISNSYKSVPGGKMDPRGQLMAGGYTDLGLTSGAYAPSTIPANLSLYQNFPANFMVTLYPPINLSGPGYQVVQWAAQGTCTITGNQHGLGTVSKSFSVVSGWLPSNTVAASSAAAAYSTFTGFNAADAGKGYGINEYFYMDGRTDTAATDYTIDSNTPAGPSVTIIHVTNFQCSGLKYNFIIKSTEPNGGNAPNLVSANRYAATFGLSNGRGIAVLGWSGPFNTAIPGSGLPFATMPACAWQNSALGDPAYTFQDVTNAQYMKAGTVIETEGSPISVGITCDWGTTTGTVADALVTGWSPTALSADGTEVAFTDDSLALQLLAPTSLPPGVRWATQQSGLGAPLIFGSSAATAKPLWTWDITSTSGKINPPPVLLTPRLMATKNALSAAYGKKTAQVTLILTTK